MKHQPYEDWILNGNSLNEKQEAELEKHLLTCRECSSLKVSWQTAEEQIRSVPARQPTAGFAQRWQASLKERKLAEERNQRRNTLIWIGCFAGAAVLALAVIFLPRLSLVQVLIDIVEALIGIATGFQTLMQLLTSVIHAVPPLALVLSSIALSTLLSITIFLWGISIWRMSRKGVTHNEEN